ncbi:MAG: hypothetical protein REJ23_15710 [Brevundimonas sp.]|nr:hypothetical protein [Brevundimonas sp.]
MIRAALTAAALLVATPAFAHEPSVDGYRLQMSVVRNGVMVISTRTQIAEGAPASATAVIDDVTYDFEANLIAVQGDGGDAQMMVEAHLARNDEQIAAPRLTFLRNQSAGIGIGDEAGDVLRMQITPIASGETRTQPEL